MLGCCACRLFLTGAALSVCRRLPSFTEAFTASVPLTRIRDIAHRNDIPSDLKREIKHTLQNKLHRNAGMYAAVMALVNDIVQLLPRPPPLTTPS